MPEHTPAPTPHRAIYGFAFAIIFVAALTFYLFWSLVPDALLVRFGLTYMPDKYFALFLPPVIAFALTLFGFVCYPALNFAGTFEVNDERTLRDSATIYRCRWTEPQQQQRGMQGSAAQRRCDRRVQRTSGWTVPELCDRHLMRQQLLTGDDNNGGESDESRRIEDYCDCEPDGQCMLQCRPGHVVELLARKTVPSVCDLSMSAVSARLFGVERDDG